MTPTTPHVDPAAPNTGPADAPLPHHDDAPVGRHHSQALIDYFMPLMAFVRSQDDTHDQPLEDTARHIDGLISQAQNQALKDGIELTTFQQALFPVLAWVDEHMSHLRQGEQREHGWQRYLLQRRYFKTGLAGREFFDRLAQLPADELDVREVYLYCLCLGFLGRYSMSPNAAELTTLRLEQYQLLQNTGRPTDTLDGDLLFPQAYRGQAAASPQDGRRRSAGRRFSKGRLLLFVLPPLILLLVALALHAELTASVQRFREVFDL